MRDQVAERDDVHHLYYPDIPRTEADKHPSSEAQNFTGLVSTKLCTVPYNQPMRSRNLALALLPAVIMGGLTLAKPAQAAVTGKWCWSMQSDSLRGTFSTVGTVPGDGTAAAGLYTINDASIYQSSFPDIEIGSINNGTYRFGTQPAYQINWNGTAVAGFWRANGTLTNGFSVYNGVSGSGATILFAIDRQSANAELDGRTIFSTSTTPDVTPVGASGLCQGEAREAPTPDWVQAIGRASKEATCVNGWNPSWHQWAVDSTGGWVCTRTIPMYGN